MQIAQAGGEQSIAAFRMYQAFAIAQAYISAAAAYTKTLAEPALPWPGNVAMANIIAGMAAVQIGMIAAARPPSFDRGGISRAGGIYQTGNIAEAHIPLESGRIPVEIAKNGEGNSGGETTIINIIANDAKSFEDMCRRNPAAITGPIMQQLRDNKIRSEFKSLVR
jgi:hypothetical protein